MPSAPSVGQRHKVNLDPITDAHILLLEFEEDAAGFVHRACVNNEDVVSAAADGVTDQTYTATAIDVVLPGMGEGEPGVQLDMSNVSRLVGRAINRASNRIGCRIMLIDTSLPDVAIIDTKNLLVIGEASGDSTRVSASLVPRASLREPVPFLRTTRAFFPGLWFSK